MIRALFEAATVPGAAAPYNNLTLKIFYPAAAADGAEARGHGVVPADDTKAPFPVVIMLPGINVGPESYGWLAQALAAAGRVVVTYSWIAEALPGFTSLTPGIDLAAVSPSTYGHGPTCPALAPILTLLAQLNAAESGVLAGLLDLHRVILGGHSAGGTIALQNLSGTWFPGVCAGFSYGGHTMAATVLGFDAGTVLPIPDDRPVLLLGGSEDGVIAASAARYNLPTGSATEALLRTFAEALSANGATYLAILEGANHFTVAYPTDETTGRAFLDGAEMADGHALRSLIIELIDLFIDGHVSDVGAARTVLRDRLRSGAPLIAQAALK